MSGVGSHFSEDMLPCFSENEIRHCAGTYEVFPGHRTLRSSLSYQRADILNFSFGKRGIVMLFSRLSVISRPHYRSAAVITPTLIMHIAIAVSFCRAFAFRNRAESYSGSFGGSSSRREFCSAFWRPIFERIRRSIPSVLSMQAHMLRMLQSYEIFQRVIVAHPIFMMDIISFRYRPKFFLVDVSMFQHLYVHIPVSSEPLIYFHSVSIAEHPQGLVL